MKRSTDFGVSCKTGKSSFEFCVSALQSLSGERRCLTLSFDWLVIRFHLENKQGVAMSCFTFFLTTKNILILSCLFNMITGKKRSLKTHFSLQGHWVCPPQGHHFASSSSPYVHISNTFNTHSHTHTLVKTHIHTLPFHCPQPLLPWRQLRWGPHLSTRHHGCVPGWGNWGSFIAI